MVFLVLKAMQAIKTGLIKRQLRLGSAVSLSLLFRHCSVGTGTAQESGFFVLLGFSSGSSCTGLLGTAAQVKWSNQKGSWLSASPAAGGQVCTWSTAIEGRSPVWDSPVSEGPGSHLGLRIPVQESQVCKARCAKHQVTPVCQGLAGP